MPAIRGSGAMKDLTRGGVHYAFEMAGSVKAMELAYKTTRRGGTTVTAGLSNPKHLFSIPHVEHRRGGTHDQG